MCAHTRVAEFLEIFLTTGNLLINGVQKHSAIVGNNNN